MLKKNGCGRHVSLFFFQCSSFHRYFFFFPTFLEVHSLEISYEFKDIWLLWSWLKKNKDRWRREKEKTQKQSEEEWERVTRKKTHFHLVANVFASWNLFLFVATLLPHLIVGREDKKHAIKMIEKCMPKIGNFFLFVHFLFWFLPPSDLKRWKDDRKRKIRFHPKDNEWWLGSNAVWKAVERSEREGERKDGKFFDNNVDTTRMTY